MAVAIYDYQSLGDGEEDSLEFEEGELIEVMSRNVGSENLPSHKTDADKICY